MTTQVTKVITVTNTTHTGAAFALTADGENCYIPVRVCETCDVRTGDVYFASLFVNHEDQREKTPWLAGRLFLDHDLTVLIDEDEDEDDDTIDTDDTPKVSTPDVSPNTPTPPTSFVPATHGLTSVRDQMFSILLNMPDRELDGLIFDSITARPSGFVGVLWDILSLTPIPYAALNETQQKCYTRLKNRCASMHKSGRLVECRITTIGTGGKSSTSVIYGVTSEQLMPA